MALKAAHIIKSVSTTILILLISIYPAGSVHASSSQAAVNTLPSIESFIDQLEDGHAEELRGVYVPGILAARVVQQPGGDRGFVSPRSSVLTQFADAAGLGSTGLLAHNFLAGASFFLLKTGQEFSLIYGDGHTKDFVIADLLRYEALQPNSTSSKFASLDDGRQLTASELFSKVYGRAGFVIFQTCIAKGANPSWGRLFVIARPVK